MNILGIGEIVLDKSCLVECFPEEGSKNMPMQVEYSIGGPVTAALILLAKHGANCTLMASIGSDHIAEKIKLILDTEQIKFMPVEQSESKLNTYIVNSKNGSRTGIKSEVTHTPIRDIPINLILEADLIIFDRHEPEAFEFVRKHKRADTQVILDPSTDISEAVLNMLSQVEHPIVPIESIQKLNPSGDLHSNMEVMREMLNKENLIVTAGHLGTIISTNGAAKLLPAIDIEAIDTLGAGDIFRGAFGYGLLQGWNITRCIEYANVTAALQCTKIGNSCAIPIPDKSEVENFIFTSTTKNISISHVIQNEKR